MDTPSGDVRDFLLAGARATLVRIHENPKSTPLQSRLTRSECSGMTAHWIDQGGSADTQQLGEDFAHLLH